jgi:hypothetical protein
MNEWLRKQAESGFPAFAGSSLSGTIALQQDLVNDVLAELLGSSGASAERPQPVDLAALRRMVKRVAIRSEVGRLLVDFSVSV